MATLIARLTKFCPSLDSRAIGLLPHVTVVLHLHRHLNHAPLPPMNHTCHTHTSPSHRISSMTFTNLKPFLSHFFSMSRKFSSTYFFRNRMISFTPSPLSSLPSSHNYPFLINLRILRHRSYFYYAFSIYPNRFSSRHHIKLPNNHFLLYTSVSLILSLVSEVLFFFVLSTMKCIAM